MEKFGFMQVLEGFWSQMLYFLRFWKVSDGKVWFIKGFGRFGCQSALELTNRYNSLSNRCSVKQFGAQGAQKHQSFQTIRFHWQIDALWAMWTISEPKAPRTLPELSKHYFSLSNRCVVRRLDAYCQNDIRALKPLSIIQRVCGPWKCRSWGGVRA